MLGGCSPPLYRAEYLSIFCPKHTIGPSDALQGSYSTVSSLSYLSISCPSPLCCPTGSHALAPTRGAVPALCHLSTASPLTPLCSPALPSPRLHAIIQSLPNGQPGTPIPSCPSKSLLCLLPYPSPVLTWPGPNVCRGLSPTRGALSWLPLARSSQLDLEVTCRSKHLIGFPQQYNCTTQAWSALSPCCS